MKRLFVLLLWAGNAFAAGRAFVHPYRIDLRAGQSTTVTASYERGFGNYDPSPNVTFYTDDPAVATVQGGIAAPAAGGTITVTAHQPGTAWIYWRIGGTSDRAAFVVVGEPCPEASARAERDVVVTTPDVPVTLRVVSANASVTWATGERGETYTFTAARVGRYVVSAIATDVCSGAATRVEFSVNVVVPKRRAR